MNYPHGHYPFRVHVSYLAVVIKAWDFTLWEEHNLRFLEPKPVVTLEEFLCGSFGCTARHNVPALCQQPRRDVMLKSMHIAWH